MEGTLKLARHVLIGALLVEWGLTAVGGSQFSALFGFAIVAGGAILFARELN